MERNKTIALFFASLVLCAIFSAVLPIFSIFSIVALPAVYGVCLGVSLSVPVILSPLPGFFLSWLLWGSPAVAIAAFLFLVPGIVLGVCLRNGSSATVITFSTGTAYAVVFAGVFAVFALAEFGSFSVAIDELVAFTSSHVNKMFERAIEYDTSGSIAKMAAQFPVDEYVASLVMLLPGTFLAVCEVLGYVLSHIARLLIRMLPVPDHLYPNERSISLPLSAAVLFIISFVISLFSKNGVVYYASENLNTVLCPALFIMGLSSCRLTVQRLSSGRKIIYILFLIVLFMLSPPVGIYSICAAGIIAVFANHIRRKLNK